MNIKLDETIELIYYKLNMTPLGCTTKSTVKFEVTLKALTIYILNTVLR